MLAAKLFNLTDFSEFTSNSGLTATNAGFKASATGTAGSAFLTIAGGAQGDDYRVSGYIDIPAVADPNGDYTGIGFGDGSGNMNCIFFQENVGIVTGFGTTQPASVANTALAIGSVTRGATYRFIYQTISNQKVHWLRIFDNSGNAVGSIVLGTSANAAFYGQARFMLFSNSSTVFRRIGIDPTPWGSDVTKPVNLDQGFKEYWTVSGDQNRTAGLWVPGSAYEQPCVTLVFHGAVGTTFHTYSPGGTNSQAAQALPYAYVNPSGYSGNASAGFDNFGNDYSYNTEITNLLNYLIGQGFKLVLTSYSMGGCLAGRILSDPQWNGQIVAAHFFRAMLDIPGFYIDNATYTADVANAWATATNLTYAQMQAATISGDPMQRMPGNVAGWSIPKLYFDYSTADTTVSYTRHSAAMITQLAAHGITPARVAVNAYQSHGDAMSPANALDWAQIATTPPLLSVGQNGQAIIAGQAYPQRIVFIGSGQVVTIGQNGQLLINGVAVQH